MRGVSKILVLLAMALGACSYTAERSLGKRNEFVKEELVGTHVETELLIDVSGRAGASDPTVKGTVTGAEVDYDDFVNVYKEIETFRYCSATPTVGEHLLTWTFGWVAAAPLWNYPSWMPFMKEAANSHLYNNPGSYTYVISKGTLTTKVYDKDKPGRVFKDDDRKFKRRALSKTPKKLPAGGSSIVIKSKNFMDLAVTGQTDDSGRFSVPVRELLAKDFDRNGGRPSGAELVLSASNSRYGNASANINVSEQELVEIVSDGNVDWSAGSPKGTPYPQVRIEVLSPETLIAGQQIRLRLNVDNTKGRGDVYRLHAFTSCQEDYYADGRCVIIGRVEAGKSKSVEVSFPTKEELFDRNLNIRFAFKELNDYIPPEQTVAIGVKAIHHADFAVTLQIFDGQGGRGIGNGNGILEKGEGPLCQIAVRNTGNARTGNTKIEVLDFPKGDSNVVLFGSLSKQLPAMDVGEVATHSFEMSLKHGFKPDRIKFRISVSEDAYKIERFQDVELLIGEENTRNALTIKRPVIVTDDKVPLYAGASKETDTLGYLPKGSRVTAGAWLGDFYRIDLAEGKVGWVETSKVKEVTSSDIVDNTPPPSIVYEADSPPMLGITSPKSGQLTDTKRIKVEGFARDDKGLKSIEYYVNGNVVIQKPLNSSKGKIQFEEFVEISDGTNRIEVVIEDLKGQQDKAAVEVTYFGVYPILKDFYKNVWVVIVGIDRYKDPNIPALKYAVKDAKGVEELVKSSVVTGRVKSLYNEEATRDNIMKLLQGELSEAGKDDAVFVYMACHGKTFDSARGALGDLIPYDGSFSDKERYKNVSMQIFKDDIAKSVSANHMLVVVDACYGGVLTRGVGIRDEDVAGGKFKNEQYLKEIKDKEAKMVITAGADNEEVLDKGINDHSVFTGRFIESLSDAKHFISAKELFNRLRFKVVEDAEKRNHKQTPQFGYWWGDGDFIFIKK